MNLPPSCETHVATFSKVTFSINIRLLPTNYHHIALAPYCADFHAKFQWEVIFLYTFELAFDIQFRHTYFHGAFYTLLHVTLIQFSKHVEKKLDQSLETKLVDWQLHLNEGYVFNTTELFTSRGLFEPPMLHSFVYADQSIVLFA